MSGVVNLNAKSEEDTRTLKEPLEVIEAKGREVFEILGQLRLGRENASPPRA
jgi:hypothetical protein